MPEKENKKNKVIFLPSGRRGEVDAGINLKEASVALGVDIEGVCGEKATCGKCKVRIEEGFFEKYHIDSKKSNLSPLTEAEKKFISTHEAKEGYRLACQAWLQGDVMVFVPEESRVKQQVVRKAAREISWLVPNPAVKKYYVELKKATLEDTLGDFERMHAELTKQYGLKDLNLDYQALLTEQKVVREGDWKVTVSVWMEKEIILIEPGRVEKSYGIAIDIGTTTVAAYLCELASGEVVATESMMNPQVIYGEDVMSRITYNMTHKDGAEIMCREIVKGLNELCGRAAAQAGLKRRDIVDMTVVGNTCMHHLFMALDTQYIGMAPFPPARHCSVNIKARDLGLKIAPGAYVHILPIEAGFVGADNVGVLLAERPYDQDSMELVIDIGTNGELILGNRDKLISSSCATGPAFEGAEIRFGCRAAPGAIEKIKIDPKTKEAQFKVIGREEWNTECEDSLAANGICGSAIIDVVPQLFMAGIINHTGRFNKDLDTPRARVTEQGPEFVVAWANETSIGQDIVACQEDVRNIQLAKGAMYSGAKLMMRHLGIEKVDKVILAGAFGSYIDKESAAVLGMFPDCDLENVYSVGNAAGDGARVALLDVDKRKEADEIARQVEYIELTVESDFDKVFSKAMWLPHMKDEFPHLKHLLPEKAAK
jgi:uncharacterized 2Fe-2S/4Fe-4S cluster protein (DUF4445 family)